MTDRRIVSICLPRFAIQRWRRRRHGGPAPAPAEAEPVVLARDGAHGPVVHDANAAAARLGIERGARVTDMRALVPELRVERAAPRADATDLHAAARWCRRWCPWTRADGTDGLLLDTTGSDALWGGETAMLADIRRAFAGLGLTARAAVAPTLGAAWALARHGADPLEVCPPDALAERLAPLPVAALRLDAETVTLLGRLGLKTVGALAALPRPALVRRFRRAEAPPANPVLRLDQAMGRTAELLVPGRPAAPLRAVRRFPEPIADAGSVARTLDDLAAELCRRMAAEETGARRLRLTGYRADGGLAEAAVGTSRASRDPAHLVRLFRDRLETLDAGFGFDALTLDIPVAEALGAAQTDLAAADGGRGGDGIDLARLVDRLVARLGPGAVLRPAAHGSHLPERADVLVPAGGDAAEGDGDRDGDRGGDRDGGGHGGNGADDGTPARWRPLRLLARPEEAEVLYTVPDGPPARLVWRRRTHRIVRSEGPERIAPEWWREKSTARLRDYYRIEDADGRRYWIFREGLAEDGRGGPPRWFVHGLDA